MALGYPWLLFLLALHLSPKQDGQAASILKLGKGWKKMEINGYI